MLEQWAPLLVFSVLSAAVPVAMLIFTKLVGVRAKKDEPGKFDNYECGEEPDGAAWVRFHPRYYIVALVFVLFDVEAAFLFPWAVAFRRLALFGFLEMLVFLVILIVGYVYAWRRGALSWV